ncbi:unnamed protein product, partial [Rotaria socialis]
ISNDNEQFREQPIDVNATNIDQAVSLSGWKKIFYERKEQLLIIIFQLKWETYS